jgi:hypothetical protein
MHRQEGGQEGELDGTLYSDLCCYWQWNLVLFVWWHWGVNSGLRACKAGKVPFKPHL